MTKWRIIKKLGSACCSFLAITSGVVLLISIVIKMLTEPGHITDKSALFSLTQQLNDVYTDDRFYNDVCWLTSHNSFAHPVPGESNVQAIRKLNILPNQIFTIEQQLLFGVKSFMIDLHFDDSNSVIIAHENIFFKQPVLPFLQTIKDWLDDNHNEIITIHFESYIENYRKIMDLIHQAKLEGYLFDLADNENWPTLGEMRETGKRLVMFSDKKLDTIIWNENDQLIDSLPYTHGFGIMHTSKYMETDFNLRRSENCEMRPDNRANPNNGSDLFVMNHFYPLTVVAGSYGVNFDEEVPFITPKLMNIPNDYKKIHGRICKCYDQQSKWPNFIAVDFVGLEGGKELNIVLDVNRNNINCIENDQEDTDEL